MNILLRNWDIILASASPRRKELLSGMGLDFEVMPLDASEEIPPGLSPAEVASYLARFKADAYPAERMKARTLIITADTIVVKDGQILGKPASREEAIHTLQKLSGERHEVITAIHLRSQHKRQTFSVTTSVWFRDLSEEDVCFYVDHFQPYDKAGSYGIQEWIGYIGICRIEGSYFNVVGLPTSRLYEELLKF